LFEPSARDGAAATRKNGWFTGVIGELRHGT